MYQYGRMMRKKMRQRCQMQEKKTKMFELQPKLTWRQLKGKKEDIIGRFVNKEMEQYLHKLYMQYEIMPMTLSMETPFNACVFIEDFNRVAKNMSNGKAMDATLMASELLKWIRPQTRQWITTYYQARFHGRLAHALD